MAMAVVEKEVGVKAVAKEKVKGEAPMEEVLEVAMAMVVKEKARVGEVMEAELVG